MQKSAVNKNKQISLSMNPPKISIPIRFRVVYRVKMRIHPRVNGLYLHSGSPYKHRNLFAVLIGLEGIYGIREVD